MPKKHHVPEFGKWDNDEDIPYTQYFDTAHTKKTGGKAANVTECHVIPASLSSDTSPVHVRPVRRTSAREVREVGHFKARESREVSGSYSDDSTPVHVLPTRRRSNSEREVVSNKVREYGEIDVHFGKVVDHRRHPSIVDNSGVRSSSNSPISRDDFIKAGIAVGRVSPVYLRPSRTSNEIVSKESSRARSISTPAGTRPKHARQASESSDQSSSMPKFGDGYTSDPLSTDGYSQTFKNTKENKPSNPVNVPSIPPKMSQRAQSKKPVKRSKSPECSRCFCFTPTNV